MSFTELILILTAAVLCIVILILLIKIHLMQKSADEIAEELEEKIKTDTNTLISVSTRDRHILSLAAILNKQLRELNQKKHLYTQGDIELKTAITNISHDLRTPLTAICGYLEVMKGEEKTPKMQDMIDIITERTELMKRLTEELFKYSVILTEEQAEQSELSVNGVLEDCIMGFYASLTEKGIVPTIEITETPVMRTGDKLSLSRVFSNIISNAIKYSDGDLDIKMDENGTIIFSNTASKLTPLQVSKLFDRFYTVESARNSTGLGLSIARTLTERMGGVIYAEYRDSILVITIQL